MKGWTPEHVRLAQAALETRDSLRSLAAQIDSAGADPMRQVALLKTARAVAVTHADMLRTALKQSGARRHQLVSETAQPIWSAQEGSR